MRLQSDNVEIRTNQVSRTKKRKKNMFKKIEIEKKKNEESENIDRATSNQRLYDRVDRYLISSHFNIITLQSHFIVLLRVETGASIGERNVLWFMIYALEKLPRVVNYTDV